MLYLRTRNNRPFFGRVSALVVQWIEYGSPKAGIRVRFSSGVLYIGKGFFANVFLFLSALYYFSAQKLIMENHNIEKRLLAKNIRPTAVRLLVADKLSGASSPLSLSELEELLPTVPKSSIFRALSLFNEQHLVHCIEDGSGWARYELCDNEHHCSVDDMHPHFYCLRCRRTYCFKETKIPVIELPNGFELHSLNYMVKGICSECSDK